MKPTLQILEDARKLIEKPEAWTTGAWARDANGNSCETLSPEAACFCIHGAIVKAAGMFEAPERGDAFGILYNLLPFEDRVGFPGAWNDNHTHADVIALLDRAIAAEREKVQA